MAKRDLKMKDQDGRINPATMRRLVLARELYDHAQEHAAGIAPVDRMIAIHNFHNALEVMLKTVIKHQEISLNRDPNFRGLQKAIDDFPENKKNGIEVPFKAELENLNKLRNQVQHDASVPAEGIMTEWKYTTQKILSELTRLFFDKEFDEISSLDLIQQDDLRELMKLAERKMRSMDDPLQRIFSGDDDQEIIYYEALGLITCAFALAFGQVCWSESFEDLGFKVSSVKISDDDPRYINLDKRVHELEIAQACNFLNIDYSSYKLLEQANVGFGKDKSGNPYLWMLVSDSSIRPAIVPMFNFVKRTLQEWQAQGWIEDYLFRSEDPLGLTALRYLDGDRVPVIPIEGDVEFESYLELSDIVSHGYLQYSPVLEDD